MPDHLLYARWKRLPRRRNRSFWRTPTCTLLMPTINLHTRRMSASGLDPDLATCSARSQLSHNILCNLRSRCASNCYRRAIKIKNARKWDSCQFEETRDRKIKYKKGQEVYNKILFSRKHEIETLRRTKLLSKMWTRKKYNSPVFYFILFYSNFRNSIILSRDKK